MYFFSRRLLVLCLLILLFLSGCSKGDSPEKPDDGAKLRIAGDTAVAPERPSEPYKGWATYTFENVRVHYPPDHPKADIVYDMVKVYLTLLRRDAQFFRMPVPLDTVEVYFYTGVGHGDAVTGTIYPHVDSSGIHFWLPGNYGPMMAGYMLRKWEAGEPRHEFLREGVVKLLDFTGRNYHQLTVELVAGDRFVPLRELAADTMFTIDTDPDRAAEAASFVDFIAYTYGIDMLKTMYTSMEPFDMVVERLFSMPVDSLEGRWLDLARRAVHPEQVLDSLPSQGSGGGGR